MKIKIESEMSGAEIIELFINQLKQNGLDPDPKDIMINVQSKDKVIQLTPDRINLSYSKVQV